MYVEAMEALIELERRCDTSQLKYGGVSYWPLCRQKIWAQLVERLILSRQATGTPSGLNSVPPQTTGGKAQLFTVGDPTLGLVQLSRSARVRAMGTGALKPRALFLVRQEEYCDTVDGARFAKTVDSVFERASARFPVGKIELYNEHSSAFRRLHPPLFFALRRAPEGVKFDPPYELENFEALTSALKAVNLTLNFHETLADMGKVFYFARLFEKLLKALRPEAVFQSVYYWPMGMAWVLAARRCGITSVDIQHGRLGPHEGHYTHQTAAPSGGYDLMPDLVWCWGQQTKHDIEHAKNAACHRHGGIVGGNTWLARWRYGKEPTAPAEVAKLDALRSGRKTILVSLQPLDAPLRSEIIDAMREGPQEWLWLLRLHPLRKHTADTLRGFLKELGIKNAEIDLATSVPLFSLLRRVDHHVTVFSSVAVEAAAFDVHTSVSGAEGLQVFGPQIKRGIFRHTPTGADIVAHAQEMMSGPRPLIRDDFIDMRPGLADEALDAIFNLPSAQ